MIEGAWHHFKKESMDELGFGKPHDKSFPDGWNEINRIASTEDRVAFHDMLIEMRKESNEAEACQECKERCHPQDGSPSKGRCERHYHDYTSHCGHQACPLSCIMVNAEHYWPEQYGPY
jgi:hypothetical protein